jgi:hypothetical protein
MTVENQKSSSENQTNLQEIKDSQKQRDFEDVLKMFEKLLPAEQKNFVETLASRDPQFKELYEQLNTYVWSEIMKIDETSQNTTSKKIIEKPKQKPKET